MIGYFAIERRPSARARRPDDQERLPSIAGRRKMGMPTTRKSADVIRVWTGHAEMHKVFGSKSLQSLPGCGLRATLAKCAKFACVAHIMGINLQSANFISRIGHSSAVPRSPLGLLANPRQYFFAALRREYPPGTNGCRHLLIDAQHFWHRNCYTLHRQA